MAETHNSNTRQSLIRSKRTTALTVALMLIISTTTGFIGGWYGAQGRNDFQTSNQPGKQIVSSESQLISQIAKDVGQSVVSVDVMSQTTSLGFFGFQPSQQESAGTGVIISSDGIIITNRHVVQTGTTKVSVTLSDGTQLDNVQVLAKTPDTDPLDIAFLKVTDAKGKKLVPAKLGDSSTIQVGDRVVAIGNALGQFQNTVTSGIISGYGRSVQAGDTSGTSSENLQDLFQTDAAINEGNSGGPLVNLNGEVIGINTAIAGGQAQNIGFAIPINDIQGIIKSVLNSGKIQQPYLGVHYINLTDDIASQFNLSVKRGAYIVANNAQPAIVASSPAEKAGLREKDIITKVNNDTLDETHSLTSVIGKHTVGESVTLTIIRNGKQHTVQVTLGSIPNS